MPKHTVRSHKRTGRRRRPRTRSAKKIGRGPRLAPTIGLLEDINEKFHSVIDEADKIENFNDMLGNDRLDVYSEEIQRAISNAYNVTADKVQKIQEACAAGTAATRVAITAAIATLR